ncbi:MAG: M1 family metallopeptidase [Proteobacteria bacterium]|nr:M1 family metallopeptidase [Pseudomonadota bacterium]
MLQKIPLVLAMVVLAIGLVSCAEKDEYDPAHDYFSYANTDEFVTRHIALDLDVDFSTEQLRGSVVLYMNAANGSGGDIILDTRDIDIDGVVFVGDDGSVTPAEFRLGENDAVLGAPLIISIPAGVNTESEFAVRIEYETSPTASALQWLPAELTAGGKHPMMYSQSQSIHARSWVPLQDTPALRITYEAVIHTPDELLAVMSADNDPLAPRRGEYHFDMPQPIPAYLLAIAVGNLYFAPLGEDTGVYTEPELLDASVYEFANTQDMLEVAVKKFGPYQWGRYDLLVLPPSFPYGGMENPRLSFITPSLLAGDRSLVSVVAHELAHSWSGNLITNATWRDGWLNEGMTSYLEGRLMEIIYDRDRVDENHVLDYQELLLDFATVPTWQQGLAPRFDVGDPDDFQGIIHYHKGQLFLQYLEESFGREVFDSFLLGYFEDFAFQTITTEAFLDYLDEKLLRASPDVVSREQVEVWMYQPGLPADAPVPSSKTLDQAAELAVAWATGDVSVDAIPVEQWSPQAMVHFLNNLPAELDTSRLERLDSTLGLSATRNAEIGRTWFIQVAKRRHEPAYQHFTEYLSRYGRTRLVAPVFAALANNGHDLELARSLFADVRRVYHPITLSRISGILDKAAVE